jgi:hypothetical protein
MIESIAIFVTSVAIGVCLVRLYTRRHLLRSWWRAR